MKAIQGTSMKRIAAVLTIALCATSLFAGLSPKYKEWARSPQSYFMTRAEQAQWSNLQTDADAEQFVNAFIAKRGGDAFVKEVAQNAAQADKYLTVGKTPGSLTARGKMMILLGPAAPASTTKKKRAGDARLGPGEPVAGLSGMTMDDMQTASNSPGNSTFFITEYTYTYPASSLPAAYGKSLTVKIEIDPGTDQDRFSSLGAGKEMDKLYEMVAQAKLAAAKTP
jgi:GWxTD domain-containing protein